jgi:hypothetical protein
MVVHERHKFIQVQTLRNSCHVKTLIPFYGGWTRSLYGRGGTQGGLELLNGG